MTATETPTDKEADRRELPGDGKKNPPPHRQNSGRATPRVKEVSQVDDRRQSMGGRLSTLTEAEDLLKNMAAPSSSDGTSRTRGPVCSGINEAERTSSYGIGAD